MLIPSFKDFGCVGDGATDDTANAQAAINYAIAGNGFLYIDAGTFYVAGGLTVSGPLTLMGTNGLSSVIKVSVSLVAGINVTTASPVSFSNFTMLGGIGSGTALIQVDPTGSHNASSMFRDLTLNYGGSGLYLGNAAWWAIDHINCYGQHGNNIYVASASAPDDGDCYIGGGCILSAPGVACIYQASAGGLKVLGNKLIGAGVAGYLLNLGTGVVTSDLIIVGNSIENMPRGVLGYAKDVSHFSNVVVTQNQFANVANPINFPAYANSLTSPNVLV